MKMKHAFIAIVAAALLLSSCDNQESADNVAEAPITVNLVLNAVKGVEQDASRTTLSSADGNISSVWAEGDKVQVYTDGIQIGELTVDASTIDNSTSVSTATFEGTAQVLTSDLSSAYFTFVYKGTPASETSGVLTYQVQPKTNVADLAAWDLAVGRAQITGEASTEHPEAGAHMHCTVNFQNIFAIGYFSTTDIPDAEAPDVTYYTEYKYNIATGTLEGTAGTLVLPKNADFYLPLLPGRVELKSALRQWGTPTGGKLGYYPGITSTGFSAEAGKFHRQSSTHSYAPIAIKKTGDWVCYNTLKGSKFTIASGVEVEFTQSNLQYVGSAATPHWALFDNQYSFLGNNNGIPTKVTTGSKIPETANVDLFGWGDVTPPFKGSKVNSDYKPAVDANYNLTTDWATKFNATTPEKLWVDYARQESPRNGSEYYCLTKDDFVALFQKQYWGFATVTLNDGTTKVKGIVFCPNSITTKTAAKEYLTLPRKFAVGTTQQTDPMPIHSENPIAQKTIDDNGLLFLPATGYRAEGNQIGQVGEFGNYWTTTRETTTEANLCAWNEVSQLKVDDKNNKYQGFAVRLAIK